MINTILLSSGIIHPGPGARWALRHSLSAAATVSLVQRPTLERVSAEDYARASLLVLYIHQQSISEAAFAHLERFVSTGGALLAVHAATASFKAFPRWFAFLGGRFVDHDRVQPMHVTPAPEATLCAGVQPFSVVDELYRHEMRVPVDVHLLAAGDDGQHPVVWTRAHGLGRIAYMLFGHRASAFRNPGVQQVLQALLAWLTEPHHGT